MKVKLRKNLAKKEIATNIKSIIGFSTKNHQKITDDIIETIITILINQKKVNIKNFGSFNIVYKNKRKGRNPKTKEEFLISKRKSIRFIVSKNLSKVLNEYNE